MANGTDVINQIKEQEDKFNQAVEEANQQAEHELQEVKNNHQDKLAKIDELVESDKTEIFSQADKQIEEKQAEFSSQEKEALAKLETISQKQIETIAQQVVTKITNSSQA